MFNLYKEKIHRKINYRNFDLKLLVECNCCAKKYYKKHIHISKNNKELFNVICNKICNTCYEKYYKL